MRIPDWAKLKCFYKLLKKGGKTNWGHRLYDLAHPKVPENSLRALRMGVLFQPDKQFRYWEFDVVESADGFLYVFHDATKRKTIARLCPTAPDELKKKPIYKLKSSQIDKLRLMNTHEKVPSLAELYSEFSRQKITKPIRVEVKKLMTQSAIKDLVHMTKVLRDQTKYDVNFMMFKKKFKRMSKENQKFFMAKLWAAGFDIDWI